MRVGGAEGPQALAGRETLLAPEKSARMRPGRPGRADGPVFDLLASKLLRPLLRPGTVRRLQLIERLARGEPCPIVSLVAPPGYGKTTLLSQWAERNGRAFAWVSVDEGDNDPKVLLTYVAEALDAVEPIDGRVFDALASPGSSVPGSVVPRLGSAFSSMTSPVVLILDDVRTLHNPECRAALSVLADHVPGGSRLALAGRDGPPLRVARLRAEGRLLEIGPEDLSLTCDEASSLLRNAEVALGEDEVAGLHRRTEAYLFEDLAKQDFDAVLKLAEQKTITVEGVVLVQKDADGEVHVVETGDHLGRKGAKIGGGVGLVVGLFAPPLLAATAVGAAAGAVLGKFAKHRLESGIAEKMDTALPPGSGGVIAVYDTEGAGAVDKALANAVKKSVAQIDGTSAKELKAGLAEAQAGMGG